MDISLKTEKFFFIYATLFRQPLWLFFFCGTRTQKKIFYLPVFVHKLKSVDSKETLDIFQKQKIFFPQWKESHTDCT